MILLLSLVFIISIVLMYKAAHYKLYNKKYNRLINLGLLLSLFILPDSIACISFALLIYRLTLWLFGPSQDELDTYYYGRFVRAKENYEKENCSNRY